MLRVIDFFLPKQVGNVQVAQNAENPDQKVPKCSGYVCPPETVYCKKIVASNKDASEIVGKLHCVALNGERYFYWIKIKIFFSLCYEHFSFVGDILMSKFFQKPNPDPSAEVHSVDISPVSYDD